MKKQLLDMNLNVQAREVAQHSTSAAEVERPEATLGGRLRMIRRGVLNQSVEVFAKVVGKGPATVKRYEANQGAPADAFLEKVSELSGVDLAWIKEGGSALLDPRDADFGAVVSGRLKRAAAQDERGASVQATGSGETKRYPSALDSIVPSKAMEGGPISTDLLIQVLTAIEQWQEANQSQIRITAAKKATLIAIAYAHFEGRKFEDREMAHILKLVA